MLFCLALLCSSLPRFNSAPKIWDGKRNEGRVDRHILFFLISLNIFLSFYFASQNLFFCISYSYINLTSPYSLGRRQRKHKEKGKKEKERGVSTSFCLTFKHE
ncbi:hypothetical protein, unlikely [Trypanosoma brucei gambiense DAL972]|uniref:T. brucei spp.-specific protein n=1 Tax=Trypanosoma brucei gambiense (strain MHOM/CI/86/DAL972) TaxID=679716 RepID=C9ZPJ0_TRYB9|nr:hypothetical protein, unlikely [Trypanosoma brucei gambiense DAL972]CBH11318.1 hypothetical protein, unlikely [Trypanosoma brucei gambiense DAL972]|eukprot:XP_011773605.1 hypothetical protein, unlikely [Trypanosoma brucei gambiense DAL972]